MGKECQDHLGNVYSSEKDMCLFYGIDPRLFCNRKKAGWSLEDCLLKPLRDNSCEDHLGNIYPSFRSMCDSYNIEWTTVRRRINSGWALSDALTKPTIKECNDYLGNTYASEKEMCDKYNIKYGTFWERVHGMGWSVERALTTPLRDNSVTDHLGNVYCSIREMCDAYGISVSCYSGRSDWSLEDALTLPPNSKNPSSELWKIRRSPASKECIDHLGNVYPSFATMCRNYGISTYTVNMRIHKYLWPLEKALTTPVKPILYDHLGNEFHSISEMCKFHGVSVNFYSKRIQKGYPLEDALNPAHKIPHKGKEPSLIPRDRNFICDHKGNEFNTLKDMLDYYGINPGTFRKRIKQNWSLKDALETPVGYKCTDHLGNTYNSAQVMCESYGISYCTYKNRISKHGWPQDKALTTPVNTVSIQYKPCMDHMGNSFPNIKQMCDAYGMDYQLYLQRKKYGWTVQEALIIPRNMYIGEYRVAECLKRLNVKFYHDCSIKTIFADLGISIDWNDFLSELQSKLGSAGYNWSKQKIQRLRPDFVLYTDEDNKIRGVIEFDGEQHQNFVEFFFKTVEEFYRRSDTDFIKQSFWEYMNIPMLRIRHDQIDMIDDMVQDFIDNPQDYVHNHNTYLSEEEYWSILTELKQQIELAFAA